jgi:hypothetical protein
MLQIVFRSRAVEWYDSDRLLGAIHRSRRATNQVTSFHSSGTITLSMNSTEPAPRGGHLGHETSVGHSPKALDEKHRAFTRYQMTFITEYKGEIRHERQPVYYAVSLPHILREYASCLCGLPISIAESAPSRHAGHGFYDHVEHVPTLSIAQRLG